MLPPQGSPDAGNALLAMLQGSHGLGGMGLPAAQLAQAPQQPPPQQQQPPPQMATSVANLFAAAQAPPVAERGRGRGRGVCSAALGTRRTLNEAEAGAVGVGGL
eukprot:5427972-Prymnesium_polylepis.1